MGAGGLFKIFLGVSASAAIMFYFVNQKQELHEVKTNYEIESFEKETAEFDRSFAIDSASFAETKKEKEYYEKEADRADLKVVNIEFKREAAEMKKLEAQKKSDQISAEIDAELASFDESDLNF